MHAPLPVTRLIGRVLANRWTPYIVLLAILAVAAFLRFYRLSDLTYFQGDQSRDATLVRDALDHWQIPSLGSIASTGTFHRGPAFYILLMPAFLVGGGDPVFGAATVAIVDLATIAMLFVLTRRWFGAGAGLIAAAIWAVSPLAVTFGRFMWNPQLVPLFTLCVFYALVRLPDDGRWLAVLAVAWSVAWQGHDQALLLVPVLAVGLFLARHAIRRRYVEIAVVAGLLSVATYLVHEATVRLADFRGMLDYILHGAAQGVSNDLSPLGRVGAMVIRVADLLPGDPAKLFLGGLVVVGLLGVAIALRSGRNAGIRALALWLIVPLLYVFWRGAFDAAYLFVIMPLVAILVGIGVATLSRVGRPLAFIAGGLVILIGGSTALADWRSLSAAPLVAGTLGSTRAVVAAIEQQAGGASFAFRLDSWRANKFDSWDVPYRYLFQQAGRSGGQLPASRVDLPTFVAFDPPDLGSGYPGTTVVDGVGIAQFVPPEVGPNLLTEPYAAGSDWTLPPDGGASVRADADGPYLALDAYPPDAVARYGRNETVTVGVSAGRYMLSFETFGAPADGSQRVYAQVLDNATNGTVLATWPDGGGYPVHPSTSWSSGSFFVDVAPGGGAVRIFLRNGGTVPASFRNVELRSVTSALIPGLPETFEP